MNDTSTQGTRRNRKRATIIIASTAIITLIATGIGIGVHAHATRTAQAEAENARQTAYAECQQASDTAKASLDAYQKAVTDTQATVQTDPATLADASTIDTLRTAQANATVTPGACDTTMDEGTLDTLTQSWKDAGNAWDKATGDVTTAAQAVTDSQSKKTLDDANTALDGQLADGRALLESSDGRVADAQTRFDLTDAINQGQALRDANSTDANAINAAAGAIHDASTEVNDSIGRKQADDAAAQAAAQAEAQRQAQAQAQAQANKTTRSTTGTTSGATRTTTRSTGGTTRTTTSGTPRATSGGSAPRATTGGTTTGTASSGSLPPSNAHNAQPDESFFRGFGGGCTSDCGTYDGWNHNIY
ncbi:hypothetical protein ACLUWO_08055 [Pseudoscardovia radai]|uniref:hypothetical protein n=1 Tax=Pseudoscardovia radai TaxID=987066 RepID=UPI0039952C54